VGGPGRRRPENHFENATPAYVPAPTPANCLSQGAATFRAAQGVAGRAGDGGQWSSDL